MTLYEIDKRIEDAMKRAIDPETGEIINDEAMAELEQLDMERPIKIENIAMYIKNLEADADVEDAKAKPFEDEAKKFKAIAKRSRNEANSLRHYLKQHLHGEAFEGKYIKISFRKSEGVVVNDLTKIPPYYLNTSPDIASIRAALKLDPESVPGAVLEERQNIQIK